MHVTADQAEMFQLPPSQQQEKTQLALLLEWGRKVGPCCTQAFLAEELKISKQRVSQLVSQGRFETAEFAGERWVSYRSICDYMLMEKRKGGRPKKVA